MNSDSAPKTFVSYAWTNEAHKAWVRSLAERLRDNGVDVVLDQWDLKPGHDAIRFMEQMISDSTVRNVIIVCDKAYVEKSDARRGGVGTEAQIISPEIYEKAADQDKFVVVSVERNAAGEPCRPIFYRSRIAIAMDEQAEFEAQYQELLRWIFDRPGRPKPPLGKVPHELLEPTKSARKLTSLAERHLQASRYGQASIGQTNEFLDAALEDLRHFEPIAEESGIHLDDKIVDAIDEMLPLSNRICEVFRADLANAASPDDMGAYHKFLEQAVSLTESDEGWFASTTWSLDHQKFFTQEIFCRLVAIALSADRFDIARFFMTARYVTTQQSIGEGPRSKSYVVFANYLESFEGRAKRIGGEAQLHASMLRNHCSGGPVAFSDYMQADFCLYLNAIFRGLKTLMSSARWWPTSLVYTANRHQAFPLFVRAESEQYSTKLARTFDLPNGGTLQERLLAIPENEDLLLKWRYRRLDVVELANAKNLNRFP